MKFDSESQGDAQADHDQNDIDEGKRGHDIDGARGPQRHRAMDPMVSVPGDSRYTPVEYSRSKIRNISSQEPIKGHTWPAAR